MFNYFVKIHNCFLKEKLGPFLWSIVYIIKTQQFMKILSFYKMMSYFSNFETNLLNGKINLL